MALGKAERIAPGTRMSIGVSKESVPAGCGPPPSYARALRALFAKPPTKQQNENFVLARRTPARVRCRDEPLELIAGK